MKKLILFMIILLAIFLRFFRLAGNPPALSWDEASLGYNAYTISETLRDEHGEFLPLARFIAFGDYKPPGYIYTAAIPVKLLGLSEWTIRFPSAISGVILVGLTYLLVNELVRKRIIAQIAALFLAASPWDLHLSRAAYESHLAALFNLSAIYLFLLSRKKGWCYVLSAVFFIFSFYTFNANRIISPLLFISLSLLNIKHIIKIKKWFVVSVVIGILLLLPSFNYLKSKESRLRFQEVSIFNNLETVKKSNTWIEKDGNLSYAKLMHNRRILYALDFLKHYSQNFDLRFLFTDGDVNPRLALPDMGQLYVFELPFVILGIFLLIKEKRKVFWFIMLWMLIVPIPAGVAKETPHALRILSILPAYQIIAAYGLFGFFLSIRNFKYLRFVIMISCLIFGANIYSYLHNYHVHFPVEYSGEWQYGYKEMVEYVEKHKDKYDRVFVTEALGRPYIYFALYKPYHPQDFFENRKETKDAFGFYSVNSLGKIKFGLKDINLSPENELIVTTPNNIPSGFRKIKTIFNLSEDEVFIIGER